MSIETIRYLDVDGNLSDSCPHIPSPDHLVNAYKTMVVTRLMDDRMIKLQRQGEISFAMSSLGEESCVVGAAAGLELQDWIYPQYRECGALFWRGYSIQKYVHHMFCNSEDANFGRQMPNHFGCKELNVVTVSSPIGTKIPHAAGAAYAMKLKGSPSVALCFFGEGATSEGDFHAGLNFAAVRGSPVIFFCRNNAYAISTPTKCQFASDGIAAKGEGYGMRTFRVDGNDFFAVYATVKQSRIIAMDEKRPVLIEAMTYRQGAHSTSDDPTQYRSQEEVEKAALANPIGRFRLFLEKRSLWDEQKEKALLSEITQTITAAIEKAKNTPPPTNVSLIQDVYAQVPHSLQLQFEDLKCQS